MQQKIRAAALALLVPLTATADDINHQNADGSTALQWAV
jgi:ankyrin repeat protein